MINVQTVGSFEEIKRKRGCWDIRGDVFKLSSCNQIMLRQNQYEMGRRQNFRVPRGQVTFKGRISIRDHLAY